MRSAALLAIAAPLVLSCCTSNKIASQVAPEFREARYERMLVLVVESDLLERQRLEKLIVASLRTAGNAATPSTEVLFVGAELTAERLIEIAAKNGSDAVLCVIPSGEGTTEVYMPQFGSSTSTATGSAHLVGSNTVTGSATANTTSFAYGGYTAHRPWSKRELRLFDVASCELAWCATVNSDGKGATSFIGDAIARQLKKDGLVAAP